MKPQDTQNFKKKMVEVFSIYQREISDIALRTWWKIFEGYPWQAINAALDQHVRKSRFFPTPADIFEILQENQVRQISAIDRGSLRQHQALVATRKILQDLRSRSSNIDTAVRAIAAAKGSLRGS